MFRGGGTEVPSTHRSAVRNAGAAAALPSSGTVAAMVATYGNTRAVAAVGAAIAASWVATLALALFVHPSVVTLARMRVLFYGTMAVLRLLCTRD